MTPGIGVKSAVHLLECFGSAARIFAATEEELTGRAALRPEAARQIVRRKGFPAAERELEHCRRNGIDSRRIDRPAIPRRCCGRSPDYPHVLYIKGDAEALTARCIAVVGTRDATPYGQHMCNRLIEGLAERVPGLCIVSGLAFGIDAAAHRAALAAGVRTVGGAGQSASGGHAGPARGTGARHSGPRRRAGHRNCRRRRSRTGRSTSRATASLPRSAPDASSSSRPTAAGRS